MSCRVLKAFTKASRAPTISARILARWASSGAVRISTVRRPLASAIELKVLAASALTQSSSIKRLLLLETLVRLTKPTATMISIMAISNPNPKIRRV